MKKFFSYFVITGFSLFIFALAILVTPNNDVPTSKLDSFFIGDMTNSKFSNMDLSGQDFTGKDLSDSNLQNSKIFGSNFHCSLDILLVKVREKLNRV